MLGPVRKLLEAVRDWVGQLARFLLHLHTPMLADQPHRPSTTSLFGRKVSPSLVTPPPPH